MTTNYSRGRAFEYKTMKHLGERGAAEVFRSAGSHKVADLIVVWPATEPWPEVWLVQCKRDGRLPEHEKNKLLTLAELTSTQAWLASQGERGTPVVLELLTREVDYSG